VSAASCGIRRRALVNSRAISTVEPYGKGTFVVTFRTGEKLISSRYQIAVMGGFFALSGSRRGWGPAHGGRPELRIGVERARTMGRLSRSRVRNLYTNFGHALTEPVARSANSFRIMGPPGRSVPP
jgi:hypothetical protein